MFNPMKAFYDHLYQEKLALQYNKKLLMNQKLALDAAIRNSDDFDTVSWLKVGSGRTEDELEKIQMKYDRVKELMSIIENPFGIEVKG